jgi:hypothetical protein
MQHQAKRLQTCAQRSLARGRPLERNEATRHAIVHSHGRLQCAAVHDLSREGIKLDNAFGLTPGDAVTVELLSRRTLGGTVAWSVAAFCGIEFDRPLAEDDPVLADA